MHTARRVEAKARVDAEANPVAEAEAGRTAAEEARAAEETKAMAAAEASRKAAAANIRVRPFCYMIGVVSRVKTMPQTAYLAQLENFFGHNPPRDGGGDVGV